MPIWNEKLQQWGFLYYEDYSPTEWLGIDRGNMPIDKPFAYHTPSADGLKRITAIRQAYSEVKKVLEDNCSPSRQLSVAITELETSAMWAIKAVVFNDPNSEVKS